MRYLSDYDRKVAVAKTVPSPKDIMCLLCEFLGEKDEAVTKKGGLQKQKRFYCMNALKDHSAATLTMDQKCTCPSQKVAAIESVIQKDASPMVITTI